MMTGLVILGVHGICKKYILEFANAWELHSNTHFIINIEIEKEC